MIEGIDVSRWQGEVNWNEVKQSGITFAMVRASYGQDGVDPDFKKNAQQAQEVGIEVGAYHYSYAKTTAESIAEAQHFLNTIKDVTLTYPVAFDIEDNSQMELGKEVLTDISQFFLNTVEKAGYYTMIYSNKYWLETKLNMEVLKQFDVWLAQYNKDGYTYNGKVGMWQYTDMGEISGVSGRVDRDKSYRDYAKIIREAGLNYLEGDEPMELTLEEAKKIIQEKCGFDDNTMMYLEFYRYAESMITRLAKAMQ